MEGKLKLSEFLNDVYTTYADNFYNYDKLEPYLVHANNDDVKNPDLKLFIKHNNLIIPIKYTGEEIQNTIPVYNYNIYNNKFNEIQKIFTRKQTIEDKVRANLVYKLNEEGRGVEESKGVEEGRGVEESKDDGSGPNVFVFDFDCTITKTHLFYFLNNKEQFKKLYGEIDEDKYTKILNYFNRDITITEVDVIEYFKETIFGDRERRNKLKIMLFLLGTENIYIASRGIKEQIIKALTLAELMIFFDTEHITGGEKPKQHILNDLIKTKNVFYTDDDLHEHLQFVRVKHINTNSVVGDKIFYYVLNEHIYIFYKFTEETNKAGGLSIEDMEIIPSIFKRIMFGGNYYNLYKKYKTKYLRLKNSMNK